MEVNRILWPTDLKEEASKVLPVLSSQAANYGATVVVLHVMDEILKSDRLAKAMNHDEAERFRSMMRADADATLDKICSMLGDSCPNYEKKVMEGDPAEEILKAIDQENIDLVILPTYTGDTKKVYTAANVAREVVSHSPVPVLAVPVK
jgi:nucleotide-binding universal stress UspA family protein